MAAQSVYLYMFLVGVFFTAANIVISGVSHMLGGFGGGGDQGAIEADGGGGAIEADGGAIELGDTGGSFDVGSGGPDAGGGFEAGDGGLELGDTSGSAFEANGSAFEANGAFDASGDISLDAGAADSTLLATDSGSVEISDFSADTDITDINAGKAPAENYSAQAASEAAEGAEIVGANMQAAGTGPINATSSGKTAIRKKSGISGVFSLLMNWLPLRPTALMCFSTVTGGVGSISMRLGWTHPVAHALSIAIGYIISMLLGVALPKRMRRAQNTSAAERYELIGLPALVTSSIIEGGFGRISYAVRDNSYSAPARHINGGRVEQGSRVVICEIKKNVFYITELNI